MAWFRRRASISSEDLGDEVAQVFLLTVTNPFEVRTQVDRLMPRVTDDVTSEELLIFHLFLSASAYLHAFVKQSAPAVERGLDVAHTLIAQQLAAAHRLTASRTAPAFMARINQAYGVYWPAMKSDLQAMQRGASADSGTVFRQLVRNFCQRVGAADPFYRTDLPDESIKDFVLLQAYSWHWYKEMRERWEKRAARTRVS
jgi:hypothetical protein